MFTIKTIQIVLTVWAIIIGGIMLTPDGIIIIVANPALRIAVGVISIVLGVAGIISLRGKTARG